MSDREEPVSILLVDDSPEKLLTLRVVLAELGETLVEASSGREALRSLLNHEFAVILLDVNMPGMDGFETASLIRQRKSSERTPIIFITAFADDTHVAQGYSLGAVDYIIAPIVPEILKSKVAVFVDLFRKTQQVQRQARSLSRRADQLHRLTEASLAINSALSLDEILRLVTETARDVLSAAAAVTLATVDADPARVRSALATSDATAGAEEPLAAAGAALSRALENQTRPVRTHAGDPAGPLPEASGPATEYWLSGPLSGRDGRPLGWIHLCCWGANFDDEDVPLLTQVAQMASIALENALASEAREANRLKDEFLATLSHELRTPLTAILGWTRILRTTAYDLQRTNHGLEVIERNVQAQARLIDDLLDVSRIIAGKLRLSLRPMAIVPAVETAIEAMRPAAEAKGVGLHLTVDPAIGRGERIDGDADRLQQVGWNLVSNAIKFTPAGGRIDVRLARSGDRFTVQVADTGKGISPSFLRHVFDRFRQADSTTTRSQGGLGIGLAIVSHIVEQHGGTVTAESGGLGQGATFTVTLPARTATAEDDDETFAERPAIEEAAAAATDLSPWRLLLVDDEVDAREVLSEVLQSFGAQVATAGSVAQALSRFAEEPPDVLISDIAMPGGDGYELLRRVRELPEERGGEVPAIALTAYAREEDRQRSFAAGFADHLAKPIEPLRLVAAVAAQATRAARASAAARTKRQVLVVEDDADSREALKTLLELSGYTVHTAETGPEGIEKALELKPHIAVVDIGLPEIDGHEVARRIRERLGSNSIFLVALTGYANESDLLRSRESGFNAHLAKPLELATLRRLLDGA